MKFRIFFKYSILLFVFACFFMCFDSFSGEKVGLDHLGPDLHDNESPIKTLKLLIGYGPKTNAFKITELFWAEVGKRVGIRVKIIFIPRKRLLPWVDKGKYDGFSGRTEGFEKKYPNIVMVPEDMGQFEIVAYSKKNKNIIINGWKSISTFRIVHLDGSVHVERQLRENGINGHGVKTFGQAFKFLKMGRADILVGVKEITLSVFKKLNMNEDIQMLTPHVTTIKAYAYLHKDFNHLIPRVSHAIKSMKDDGTYDEIRHKLRTEK